MWCGVVLAESSGQSAATTPWIMYMLVCGGGYHMKITFTYDDLQYKLLFTTAIYVDWNNTQTEII